MSCLFPETSATLIARIKDLPPGEDAAAWVRFWDLYWGAIRSYAALKGGEENADDILMVVLGKLVNVLREGKFVAERGRFHSFLATMIANEVHMAHRKDVVRARDRHVSIDAPAGDGSGGSSRTIGEALPATAVSFDVDEDAWRKAILENAVTHVLEHTALSPRDRGVYREFAQEGRDIGEVAARYGISRNLVSQIKVRVDRRIVSVGREMLAGLA